MFKEEKARGVTFLYRGCTLHFVDLHSKISAWLNSVPFVDDNRHILHRDNVHLLLMLAVANFGHANTDTCDITAYK